MESIIKIWDDPVFSKVIAAAIISICGYPFYYFRHNIVSWLISALSKLQADNLSGITILDENPLKITINSHRDNDIVDNKLKFFHGNLDNKPKDSFCLWVVRRWSTKLDEYYPVKKAYIKPARGSNGYEWEVEDCDVGGDSGDGRILEVWLVGPDGQLLLNTWSSMSRQYGKLMDETKMAWETKWLKPSITGTTKDMVLCAKVKLIRK